MNTEADFQSELLRGRDYIGIGHSEIRSAGSCAIAISAGGAAKTYSHTEPNEDGALLLEGPAGSLIAVADGHHGAAGSAVALEILSKKTHWTTEDPGLDTPATWHREILAVLIEQNNAILAVAKKTGGPPSPTTLSIAVIRPRQNLLIHGVIGDSHLFVAEQAGVTDLGWRALGGGRKTFFLGSRAETPKSLGVKVSIGCRPLSGARAVVLATDGLSENGIGVSDPPKTVTHVVRAATLDDPHAGAQIVTRGVLAAAMAAHREHQAGDNIAVAVSCFGDMAP